MTPTCKARRDVKKAARTLIYNDMYGRGSNKATVQPPWDSTRKHPDTDKVSWEGVAYTIKTFWSRAAFDEKTLSKILQDFNVYAKGRTVLLRSDLV